MSALHLRLENITKAYGRKKVLKDLFLDLEAGTFAGITGPSGSGKSTLGRIAAGLEKPDQGGVFWDQRNILEHWPQRHRGGRICLLPQNAEAALNPLKTVRSLLEEFCPRDRKTDRAALIAAALERVELSPELLSYRPPELSGGMNQRLLLTRLLLRSPDCLILDEAGTGLDASVAAGLYRLISAIKGEGRLSCLMISHEREVLDFLCDRIYVLESLHLKEL
jgi:ABC-type dipeptide/oligopeptide/nickel transport system ATPase subunit